jgi:receptor expression-enhancing protein 5/6
MSSLLTFAFGFADYCTNLVIVFIKFAYPMYASYKALRSEGDGDDRFWMIYWTIIGLESFIEAYVAPFLGWFPFFMIARLLFYIWLQMPIFRGSVIIFKKFVQPYFEETGDVVSEFVSGTTANEPQSQAFREAYSEILTSLT